jgi:hypothetical protein
MYLRRQSLSTLMLLGALVSPQALASVQAPGGPAQGHPLVFQLATLPQDARLRRRARGSKARVIAWWNRRRMRDVAATVSAGAENVEPRIPPHESYARGPP